MVQDIEKRIKGINHIMMSVYYNNEVMNTDILTIPHPRMHERMFTLVPLAEIAPDFIIRHLILIPMN